MKKIVAISLALLLGACASIPEPQAPAQKAPIARQTSKAVAKPVAVATEVKPSTFKQRWYDRFLKHKSK
jgi:starvation-inducible outer membrane lipoprotein